MADVEAMVALWRAAVADRDAQIAALRAAPGPETSTADAGALAAARAELDEKRRLLAAREREVSELARMLKAWEAMRVAKDATIAELHARLASAEAAARRTGTAERITVRAAAAVARSAGKENAVSGRKPETSTPTPPSPLRALRPLAASPR